MDPCLRPHAAASRQLWHSLRGTQHASADAALALLFAGSSRNGVSARVILIQRHAPHRALDVPCGPPALPSGPTLIGALGWPGEMTISASNHDGHRSCFGGTDDLSNCASTLITLRSHALRALSARSRFANKHTQEHSDTALLRICIVPCVLVETHSSARCVDESAMMGSVISITRSSSCSAGT